MHDIDQGMNKVAALAELVWANSAQRVRLVQVLYKYPPDQPVISDVAAFCFPHGVQPMLLERTPSMSSLNQLINSQRFQQSDDSSFIFLLKVLR